MTMCSSVQTTLPKSSAAQKLAARFPPVISKSVYSSKTNSWSNESNIYTIIRPIRPFSGDGLEPLPIPLADLTKVRRMCQGWIKTKLTDLIDNVNKFLNDPSHYIHQVEHDRIMTKFNQNLEELNKNFDEMFNHDFEGQYLDDTEFKQEIKEEYLNEIIGDLITDYQTLIDAEEIFIESQNNFAKAFCDDYDKFKKAFKAILFPEQIALHESEDESLISNDEE